MPLHKQVTTCRKSGDPVSAFCSCAHCALSVCSVCGTYEGSLTTDCPGEQVAFDKQQEIYETTLDYTDERGWHLGEATARRSPRFEKPSADDGAPKPTATAGHLPLTDAKDPRIVGCTCGWRTPQGATDSDDAFATHAASASLTPSTNWEAVERTLDLEHELALKAVAWVLADRSCEDHSVTLARLEEEVDEQLQKGQAPPDLDSELLRKLEHAKIDFRLADQRAQKCDDEFRQAARKLVDALEKGSPTVLTVGAESIGAREL